MDGNARNWRKWKEIGGKEMKRKLSPAIPPKLWHYKMTRLDPFQRLWNGPIAVGLATNAPCFLCPVRKTKRKEKKWNDGKWKLWDSRGDWAYGKQCKYVWPSCVFLFAHVCSIFGIVVPVCMLPDAALMGSLIYVAGAFFRGKFRHLTSDIRRPSQQLETTVSSTISYWEATCSSTVNSWEPNISATISSKSS